MPTERQKLLDGLDLDELRDMADYLTKRVAELQSDRIAVPEWENPFKKPPPDLMIVISRWTRAIHDWNKALRKIVPYRDYLDNSPKIATEFRDEVRGLIADLKQFAGGEK